MIKIFHNPRCRKSREGLQILQDSGKEFEVVLYLQDIPDKKTMSDLISKLDINPDQLLRKNEADWKEHFRGKDLTDEEVIEAMIKYPKLIERPIVVDDKRAVLGRPPELIKEFLDQ